MSDEDFEYLMEDLWGYTSEEDRKELTLNAMGITLNGEDLGDGVLIITPNDDTESRYAGVEGFGEF